MDRKTSTPEKLLYDEVVQYIAHRHHVTAGEVIDSFIRDGRPKVDLENNEINILRDLIRMYNHNK